MPSSLTGLSPFHDTTAAIAAVSLLPGIGHHHFKDRALEVFLLICHNYDGSK